MAWQILGSVWVVLAGLAFVLVTVVGYVLASHRQFETAIHDRLRESKALRAQYYAAQVRARQTRKGNVIVEE